MFIPYFQQCRFALSHLQAFSKTNTEEFVIHKHMHFLLKLSSPSFPKGFPFNGVLSKKDFEKPQGLASKQMLNTLSVEPRGWRRDECKRVSGWGARDSRTKQPAQGRCTGERIPGSIGVSSQTAAGYYFSGCACYNSAGKREKTLTFLSILKRTSVNLAHRYKGKC